MKKFEDMELGVEFICKACKFWDRDINDVDIGRCRFHAPTCLSTVSFEDNDPIGVWPITHEDDWCSDFGPNRPLVAMAKSEHREEVEAKIGEVIHKLKLSVDHSDCGDDCIHEKKETH